MSEKIKKFKIGIDKKPTWQELSEIANVEIIDNAAQIKQDFPGLKHENIFAIRSQDIPAVMRLLDGLGFKSIARDAGVLYASVPSSDGKSLVMLQRAAGKEIYKFKIPEPSVRLIKKIKDGNIK